MTQPEKTIAVIEIAERLDTASVTDFKNAVQAVLETTAGLIFDLSKTSFIDSTGLGALVSLLKTCNQLKVKLYLVGLTPQVRQIFELTRLYRLFDIFDTVQQAKADFAEPGAVAPSMNKAG